MESLERGKIDLAIVDLNLPDGNGFKIVEKIRELSKEVPIAILTSEPSEAHLKEISAYKINAFIEKSEDIDKILEFVRRYNT